MSPQARREVLIDEARGLYEQGWTQVRLAEYFEVQPATVRRWLDPAHDEAERIKNKERKKRYRGKCLICGARTSGSNGLTLAPKYCTKHWDLNPDRVVRELWPKKRIIHAIQEWAAIYGEPPAMADWNPQQARILGNEKRAVYFEQNRDIWPWFTQAVLKFGSWNAAIEAAGFSPRPPHGTLESAKKIRRYQKEEEKKPTDPRRYWTRDLIIDKMHEFHALYGKPPTSTVWLQPVEIVNGHRIWPTTGAVQKEFGSWNRGVRAAGFEPRSQKKVTSKEANQKKPRHTPRKWTKEEILDIFRAWVEEHRIPPTRDEWSELEDRPSPTTVYEMFGSWNEAIRQAGFYALPHGISASHVKKLLPLPRER